MLLFAAESAKTWAEVGERLGIPALITLVLLSMLGFAAAWIARNMLKPLTQEFIRFMRAASESDKKMNARHERMENRLDGLDKRLQQNGERIEEVQSDVRQLKGMVGKLPRAGS